MTDREILTKARAHAFSLIEQVDHYPYHNLGHTIDVYARAAYLADMEGVDEEKKTDLLIAAAFHDTGFSVSYPQNESIGADIAENFLRANGHPEERIFRVRRVILATVLFSPTGDLLEKIIQDADLDNLGREDFFINTERVSHELRTIAGGPYDHEKFLAFSESIIARFSFNTETARREREERRLKNLDAFKARFL